MTKLETIQKWAERYTQKLGVIDRVRVIPSKECPNPGGGGKTHCHTKGKDRGVICWHNREVNKDRRGWKWTIAHEVCHLKVQSHSSPYFDKWMAFLGFKAEKRQAQIAGVIRHKHDWLWSYPRYDDLNKAKQHCRICGADRTGTITWDKIEKGAR